MINNNNNHVSGIKKNSTNYIMSSNNSIFDSGKYSGKTFKEVYDKYPEYFPESKIELFEGII